MDDEDKDKAAVDTRSSTEQRLDPQPRGPGDLADAAAPPLVPMAGAPVQKGAPTAGLSASPGLRPLDSQVPGLPGGGMVNHVSGPGQSPVDPIAAGLDLNYNPLTAAEDRLITQTGTHGAGARPSTYNHIPGDPPPQAGVSDHSNVPAPSDGGGEPAKA